jgi:hypothetical protein
VADKRRWCIVIAKHAPYNSKMGPRSYWAAHKSFSYVPLTFATEEDAGKYLMKVFRRPKFDVPFDIKIVRTGYVSELYRKGARRKEALTRAIIANRTRRKFEREYGYA